MSIQEQLMEDLKAAMKAKDMLKVNTIRMLRAQLKDFQIAKGEELSEEDVLQVLSNAAKKRKEAIEIYETSSRVDLIEKEKTELKIISAYLPEQLSEEEIEQIVVKVIEETGVQSMKEFGKVMSATMSQLKGRADGKKVQEIVRTKLSG
ncbi:MAG: GatB/YqeY domain-containing protein [bacterium]